MSWILQIYSSIMRHIYTKSILSRLQNGRISHTNERTTEGERESEWGETAQTFYFYPNQNATLDAMHTHPLPPSQHFPSSFTLPAGLRLVRCTHWPNPWATGVIVSTGGSGVGETRILVHPRRQLLRGVIFHPRFSNYRIMPGETAWHGNYLRCLTSLAPSRACF